MRRWIGVVAVVVAAVFAAAGSAGACQVCDPTLVCVNTTGGALICLGNGVTCFMSGPCLHGIRRDPMEDGLQVTLLEDAATRGTTAPARLVRGLGRCAAGRHAVRAARGDMAAGDPSAIVWSGFGRTSGDVTAAFASPDGDGFTLRREREGRGARLTVCALEGGRPGRVLAREHAGEDDALVVRVTLGHRTRVLVVQAATLPEREAAARDDEARAELRTALAARPTPLAPPFELRLLEP